MKGGKHNKNAIRHFSFLPLNIIEFLMSDSPRSPVSHAIFMEVSVWASANDQIIIKPCYRQYQVLCDDNAIFSRWCQTIVTFTTSLLALPHLKTHLNALTIKFYRIMLYFCGLFYHIFEDCKGRDFLLFFFHSSFFSFLLSFFFLFS